MVEQERVKIGVTELDKALNGGVPKGNVVLLAGGAGTGKSTLCLQYLYYGAQQGEAGLYISTEQSKSELLKTASFYGWDLNELEEKNLLKIIYFDAVSGFDFMKQIQKLYDEFSPKRIVIDSLSTLTDSMIVSGLQEDTAFSMVQIAESVAPIPRTEKVMTKALLYRLMNRLRSFDTTTVMTSELPEQDNNLSADGVTEFICDGVIILYYLGVGSVENRSLIIRKMRYTDHNKKTMLYEMGKNGIQIIQEEEFKI